MKNIYTALMVVLLTVAILISGCAGEVEEATPVEEVTQAEEVTPVEEVAQAKNGDVVKVH